MSNWVGVLLIGLVGALSLPATAAATRYVVAQDGSGDFATVQAAMDAHITAPRDSVLIMPGDYPEMIAALPAGVSGVTIIGVEGAELTTVASIQPPAAGNWSHRRLQGIGFTGSVQLTDYDPGRLSFEKCTFRDTVDSHSVEGGYANFRNCDFFAPTRLEQYVSTFDSLRFHSAPLVATHAWGTGSVFFRDCVFEGPADTLVYIPWSVSYDVVSFSRCTFRSASRAIVFGDEYTSNNTPISACKFEDIAGTAVFLRDSTVARHDYQAKTLRLQDSRFERCGTAVHWVALHPDLHGGRAFLERDTVLSSAGDGVVLGPSFVGTVMSQCVVDGSGGYGGVVLQNLSVTTPQYYGAGDLVSDSRFTNNQHDGLCIQDTFPLPNTKEGSRGPLITNSYFGSNGGAGLRITASGWRVEGCVAASNGADGFVLTNATPAYPHGVVSNTSVRNAKSGFAFDVLGNAKDSLDLVRNNLAVLNLRYGFQMPHASTGSFAFNDSWGNYLAQYVGAWSSADSNLTVDPLFCDLAAGDLGLQQGSPCGAGGVYGLIGALPESCPNLVTVEPAPLPGVAFAVRPSVARGSVEFSVPAGPGSASVEVYDVSGRTVWRATTGASGGTIRWRGEGETGRVPAGLYWARLVRGGDAATRRLVGLD